MDYDILLVNYADIPDFPEEGLVKWDLITSVPDQDLGKLVGRHKLRAKIFLINDDGLLEEKESSYNIREKLGNYEHLGKDKIYPIAFNIGEVIDEFKAKFEESKYINKDILLVFNDETNTTDVYIARENNLNPPD